ncbi:diguanylate cyclase [Bacillus sp. DNRA2]|uniref:GGDEF domain-containing protein n=1 Tax=Bacillus sp. DNRA2 TaxID=2723053 RepID=UPI00145E18BD|nr:diguanylate cyclase [Bacillus sp. DNRA2]NMD71129.1 diguanylate cyclase [Bacillus sp. DNRA2]
MKYKGRLVGITLVILQLIMWIFHHKLHFTETGNKIFEMIMIVFYIPIFWILGKIYDRNKHHTKELKTSNKRFQTIFEKAGIGVALIDQNGRPVMVNPKLQEMLGYSESELTKLTLNDISVPEDAQINYEQLHKLVKMEIESYTLEKRYIRKDGQIVWGEVTSSLFPNNQGDFSYVIGMVNDITERKATEQKLMKLNQELEYRSNRDGLTGIANRRYFDEQFDFEWTKAEKLKQPLSLIMFDLDFFKNYNDTYGHIMGDNCLKSVARLLSGVTDYPICLPARYGGEEFAIIVPNSTLRDAEIIAEQIRLDVEELKLPHKQSVISPFVTISVGVASIIPDSGSNSETLIHFADQALYQAKLNGRNQIYCLQAVELVH